jgi:large subunit ribosomal protein L13
MRTYVPKQAEVREGWWLVDAEGLILGRLACQVAARLRGKHRPTFAPFLDNGDHVVVVNADKLVLSGRKDTDKIYRRHSGYPGGLKDTTAGKILSKRPERLVEMAVRGMLPKGPLGRKMFRKLKVYTGPRHPHEAQRPQAMPLAKGTRAPEGRD